MFWLSLVSLLVVLYVAREAWLSRSLTDIGTIEPLPIRNDLPRVTVLVAARNEALTIENGVRSLLKLDYPNLEVLVVEDRSTDNTFAVLERIQREQPRLKIKRIRELPAGWLGKNHALAEGWREVSGEWVLMTDADVVFTPDVLRRAIAYAQRESLDHLAAFPTVIVPGLLGESFLAMFQVMFGLTMDLRKVRDPNHPAAVGLGAFNLVKRSAYQRSGGFAKLPLRPDDDVALARVLKASGARTDVIAAPDFVAVRWYENFGEIVRGLEKNALAPLHYSLPRIMGASAAVFVTFLWPYIGLFVQRVGTLGWGLSLAAGLILWTVAMASAHRMRVPMISRGLMFPVAVVLFSYIIWRNTVLLFTRGGIYWRDTFYSLRDLRSNHI